MSAIEFLPYADWACAKAHAPAGAILGKTEGGFLAFPDQAAYDAWKKRRTGRPRKLASDTEAVISALHAEGSRMIDLAERYGVAISTIHAVIHRTKAKAFRTK